MPTKSARFRAKPGGSGRRRTPTSQSPALSTLAVLTEALVMECAGDRIVALNKAGSVLLGYGRRSPADQPLSPHLPKGLTPARLTAGRQPKRLSLVTRAGKAVPVALRAVRLPGPGSHVLIVAQPVADSAPDEAAALRALSLQNQRIVEAASDGIVSIALDGTIQSANRAAADILNRDVSALIGMSLDRAFVHGSGAATGVAGKPAPIRAQLWTGPHHIALEVRLARSDGESFDAEYTIAPITEGREIRGYVVSFRDITERKRADAEMRLSAAVFEHSLEGLLIADARGRVTKTNPAYCRITGYQAKELNGRQIDEVLLADSKASPGVLDPLRTLAQTEWEQWCKSKSGKRYAARITMSVVRDQQGRVQQYAAIISDITQRKLDEEKILYQANYDQLTGLANRTLFMDRLMRLIVESRRAKNNVGLMFIDLDGFKAINDTLGHDAGDLLLQGCARRLEKCVRESDTVARLGGDEFTVIMPLIDGPEAAAVVAERIIRSLGEPFDLDGRQGHVSASIGISILPAQASDASKLLHNADIAMYFAKRQGKANFQHYRADLEVDPARG